MTDSIDQIKYQLITEEPPEYNINGHKKGCTCVDCFGDFSGGDDENY